MIDLVFVAIAGIAAGWVLHDLIRRDAKARGELLDMTRLSREQHERRGRRIW